MPQKRARLAELTKEIESPDVWKDRERVTRAQKERAAVERELGEVEELSSALQYLKATEALLARESDEVRTRDAQRERERLAARVIALERVAFFSGTHDSRPALLTLSAGAGGTDAQDWAGLLLRMYLRYGERKGWSAETLDEQRGQEAGLKHVTVRFDGAYAYGHLKHEAGVHRLVRLSPFNADRLRQTSFALVDVIPEIAAETVRVQPEDVEFEAFRSSGKGGQNVQKVSTAVRIRHLPTGIVVTCQTERSQLQNRERALAVLLSKLEYARERQHAATIAELRGVVPEAEWGRQIRSYVLHPYKQVKDHRTGFETADAEGVLDGALDPLVEASLMGG